MTTLRSLRVSTMLLLVPLALAACSQSSGKSSGDAAQGAAGSGAADVADVDLSAVPADYQRGAALYNATCATCHGVEGRGTEEGPPHVDLVYEPNHHPDDAFRAAVSIGVSSHHWEFGDMEPVVGLSDEDVDEIIGYVRYIQRQAGIE